MKGKFSWESVLRLVPKKLFVNPQLIQESLDIKRKETGKQLNDLAMDVFIVLSSHGYSKKMSLNEGIVYSQIQEQNYSISDINIFIFITLLIYKIKEHKGTLHW